MATEREELINILNELIQTCRDSEEGYKQASDAVDSSDLTQLFDELRVQRGSFAQELQTGVDGLGGEPVEGGTIEGAIERGWASILDILSSRDEDAVLFECERRENETVDSYKAVIGLDLPLEIRKIVESQLQAIQNAHQTIRQLQRSRQVPQ